MITQVTTTPASADDHEALEPIQADLAARDLLPGEHYVDSGYVDAQALGDSPERGITLVGPVQVDGSWQAHTPTGMTAGPFTIDWGAQRVVCPLGTVSQSWQPYTDRYGNGGYVVQFPRRACGGCHRRPDCTRAQRAGRQLTLRPREQHIALHTARAWQETPEFKAQYARRAGVEGTFTQANRRCDLRHARYLGLAKTHLQHILTAVAINLLRVLAWLAEVPRGRTRTSPFAALMGATS